MQNRDLDKHYADPNSNLAQLVQLPQLRDNFPTSSLIFYLERRLCFLQVEFLSCFAAIKKITEVEENGSRRLFIKYLSRSLL
jgi:hypothetical protein